MNDLRSPPPLPPYPGVAGANGAGPAPPSQFFPPNNVSSRRRIHMAKYAGEGSFGMTLDQDPHAAATDYPRVSYVFPNSAASRAGVCSGWTIESINGVCCRGRRVRDVAPMFRELQEVTMCVDLRTETAPVATLPPLVGTQYQSPLPSPVGMPSPMPQYAPPPPTAARVPVPASVLHVTGYSTVPMASYPMSMVNVNANSYMVATTAASTNHSMSSQYQTHPPTVVSSHYGQAPMAPTWHPPTVAQSRITPTSATPSQPPLQSAHGVSPPPSAPAGSTVTSSKPPVPLSAPPTAKTAPPQAIPPRVPTLVAATRPPATTASSPLVTVQPKTSASSAPAAATSTSSAVRTTSPAAPSSATTASAATPVPPSTNTTTTPRTSATSQATNGSARAPGKKRARAQSDQHVPPSAVPTAPAPVAAPHAPPKRRGRPPKRRQSAPPSVSPVWDPEDAAFFYGSDSDVEEVPPPTASGRRTSSRQAESGGRARHSLTVTRLVDMGFRHEDAVLSVEACGNDPEKCMLWIISYIEDRQFTSDLNAASIESENQRRLEEQEQRRQESETLRQATAFTSLFESSFILSDYAEAPRLKGMLATTIGDIAADTLMRTLLTKLLTVESKAIKWYKDASKCYMLQLAGRLETAFETHDALTCCSTLMATQPATEGCSFVQALHEEEQALSKALFFLGENQGGVPLEFLRADESMQFSLDDDGFEVVEPPPSAASPGHD